jgi:ornithine cyclodeaminase
LLSTSLTITNNTPRRIIAFGAGNQIEAHIDLYLRFLPGMQNCTIVNRTVNDRFKSLINRLSSSFPKVQFTPLENTPAATEVEEAVSSADVIICATSSTVPLFPSRWVKAGTQIVLVGSYTPDMHEVDTDLVKRATSRHFEGHESNVKPFLLVDSWDACSKEAGELIKANIVRDDVRELGELLPRDPSGRLDFAHLNAILLSKQTSEPVIVDCEPDFTDPVIIFKSVGIGLQDVAIASAVVQKAEELGVGTIVDGYDD